MVSDVIDALQRSWSPGYFQTNHFFLASDGSILSPLFLSDGEINDEMVFVYELYIAQTYQFNCAYSAVIVDATGFCLAYDLHREQGDPEAPMFRKYGENDRLEYFSDSLDMVYSWVARVLHTLRRKAEGR